MSKAYRIILIAGDGLMRIDFPLITGESLEEAKARALNLIHPAIVNDFIVAKRSRELSCMEINAIMETM
jgi:hypothetical protein